MEIVFNEVEEKAIQRYADKHKITYGEGLQQIIDAMTKGLVELASEDNEFENIKDKNITTKVETLDNSPSDSDNH